MTDDLANLQESPRQTGDAQVFTAMIRQTMQDFATAWFRGDVAALMALFGADPVYRTPSGVTFTGAAHSTTGC